MQFIYCSNDKIFAKKLAKRYNKPYSKLIVRKFPDGELYIRFPEDIKNKDIILVQTFHGDIHSQILEVIFAAYTAKRIGAKKVYLLSTYLPYFRQDKEFHGGESISIDILNKLFKNCIDKIFVVSPHLHRRKKINKVFTFPAQVIDVTPAISGFIKNKIKNPILIGPDIESKQWVKPIADSIKARFIILKKHRYSSRKVVINFKKYDWIKGRNVVIVDDIISTGQTILETIKHLKKNNPKNIYCIAIHGLFLEDSLKQLEKYSTVFSTNTIMSKASKIDITSCLEQSLQSYI